MTANYSRFMAVNVGIKSVVREQRAGTCVNRTLVRLHERECERSRESSATRDSSVTGL